MTITGIDALEFGVADMEECSRFFGDWGLKRRTGDGNVTCFETLDGCEIILRPVDSADLPPAIEPGPTLRRVIWGTATQSDLGALAKRIGALDGFAEEAAGPSLTDPIGLRLSFRVSKRRPVTARGSPMNTIDRPDARANERARVYERAQPVKIGHVVLFAPNAKATAAFYMDTLGFRLSDYYPDSGYFLRCRAEGGHHDLFLLQTPEGKRGFNHAAFSVRDIHEVFGGGLHVARCGWQTQIGPGRHPISSAYFWYVTCPAGGLVEYYADEDWCGEGWQAKAWERTPEHFAEWAIAGGLDGTTRRQHRGKG